MDGTDHPALLVVDVQNDFCPGGALAVPEGDQIIPVVNAYIERFIAAGVPIYVSRDWHPERSVHFTDYGGQWPPHCIQNTTGAAFHPNLHVPEQATIISKGMRPEEDAYSNFEGFTPDGERFADRLARDGVTHLYVCGLATDYCVRASVLDALRHGIAVTLLIDAVRGVDVVPGDSERAIAEMLAAGAKAGTLESVHPEDRRRS